MDREQIGWLPEGRDAAPPGNGCTVAPRKADLEELIRCQRPVLYGYLRRRCRNDDDAADLLQNVCLKAARAYGGFRHDCPESQWLLRIAANELKNYYRRLSGEPTPIADWTEEFSEDLQHDAGSPCPYADADRRIAAQMLIDAMAEACTDDERNVITMVYQGESLDEAAATLGMNAATARSHFLRGRAKLLAHLAVHQPSLLGGESAIEEAVTKARSCTGAERLDTGEYLAFQSKRSASKLRSACLKFARFLPAPLVLLAFMGVQWIG